MEVPLPTRGDVPVPPPWLRPLAWGCAAIVMAFTVALAWSTCSLRRVVAAGLDRLSQRVLGALPADTPRASREALRAKLACAVEAASQRRAGERELGDLARTCRAALADSRVNEEELAAILVAAERVCPGPESGGP